MTSRRDFLGILAAAPVAVPAALSSPQPRYASGGILRESSWGVVGEACHGSPFSPSKVRTLTIDVDTKDLVARLSGLQRQMLLSQGMMVDQGGIPNRLLGTYINENGEAV